MQSSCEGWEVALLTLVPSSPLGMPDSRSVPQLCPNGHPLRPIEDFWGVDEEGCLQVYLSTCDQCVAVFGVPKEGATKLVRTVGAPVWFLRGIGLGMTDESICQVDGCSRPAAATLTVRFKPLAQNEVREQVETPVRLCAEDARIQASRFPESRLVFDD